MDFYNNEKTLKVERRNALGMIEGFHNIQGQRFFSTIFTAHETAKSLQGNFRSKLITDIRPKLITLIKKHKKKYVPNFRILDKYAVKNYQHKYTYVAFLDRIFHIKNSYDIWEKLCNNGIFDIWDPIAPYNSLIDEDTQIEKKDPMILLLRIFEVENDFSQKVKPWIYWDNIESPPIKLKIVRPMIPQNKNDQFSDGFKGNDYFDDIKEKIRISLGGSLLKVDPIFDTSLITF